jgi:hypothetical protein
MKKNNILPITDLQNSREYVGAYNSRDFYKGTSFKMAGEWIANTHYFNDEYIVDFVAFEGALLSCTRSHTSSSLNMPELVWEENKIIGIKPNLFWAFVMAGVEGPTGKVWVPEINNGLLSWKESNTSPSSTPIENLKGEPGDTPIVGIKKDTSNNTYYWTVSINGESPRWILDENGQKISAQGLKGDPGKNGTDGKPGENGADGITPEFRIENNYWEVSYNKGANWTQLGQAKGDRGATGEKGKDAIQPKFRISLGNWEVSYDKGLNWEKVGRATGSKGDPGKDGIDGRAGKDGKDGITPEFKIVNNNWYITYNEGSSWKLLGRAIGDQGEPGKTPGLIREFGDPNNLTDDRILWGYIGDPTSEWTTLCYLEDLKGDSIKSVNISDAEGHLEITMESSKVITSTGSVLPRFEPGTIETVEWDQRPSLVIDKTNAPREWALNVKVPKGKPATVTVVSEVEKLAPDAQPYVTDLNPDISGANLKFGIPQGEKGDPGDENIAIGCQSDFPNNEPEHDKIWYDPCDEAMDQYSVQDFLYHSYIAVGGTLNQEQFEAAWKSFPNTAGVVEIIDSLESDKTDAALSAAQGKALKTLIDDLKASVAAALDYKGTKDTYDALPTEGNKKGDVWNVVAAHGTTPAGTNYAWDGAKWDPLGGTIDLSGYYTKSQVDDAISAAKTELEAADTALEGQITTVTNQLNNKVDKVEGSGLISDTDLNQIRTNKSDIESLQTSVGGKQDELTPGNAVSITEENVIDVKLDPASNEALSKSAEGLKLDLSGIKGSTVKVGVSITGGAEIGADQTIAAGMQALSDSIRTAVVGGITSLTSPDETITITSTGTSRGLAINTAKLVSTTSSIQVGDDGKLDMFWIEIE